MPFNEAPLRSKVRSAFYVHTPFRVRSYFRFHYGLTMAWHQDGVQSYENKRDGEQSPLESARCVTMIQHKIETRSGHWGQGCYTETNEFCWSDEPRHSSPSPFLLAVCPQCRDLGAHSDRRTQGRWQTLIHWIRYPRIRLWLNIVNQIEMACNIMESRCKSCCVISLNHDRILESIFTLWLKQQILGLFSHWEFCLAQNFEVNWKK